MTTYHPAPFGDFSTEVSDPWPVVERLRLALVEAQYYTPGDTNITGLSIDALLELLPNEDD
jgi:hypothetical protein